MAKRGVSKLPRWAKIVLWVFGVLVIGVVLYLIFFLVAPYTVRWHQYSSDKGFSFKYPSNWSVQTIKVLSGAAKYKYGQEYLLTVSNIRFFVDYESDRESARIVFTRYPLSSLGTVSAGDLANQSKGNASGSVYPMELFKIGPFPSWRYVVYTTGERDLLYWIRTSKYVYAVSGIIFTSNRSWFSTEYYESLVRTVVASFSTNQ